MKGKWNSLTKNVPLNMKRNKFCIKSKNKKKISQVVIIWKNRVKIIFNFKNAGKKTKMGK